MLICNALTGFFLGRNPLVCDTVFVFGLGVTSQHDAGDGEGQLVEVTKHDAGHRVTAEQLH